jgi:type I restriction enzyme R subunit
MIVTLSRQVAANLYEQIIKLRPDWHSDDLNSGKIKVVMKDAQVAKQRGEELGLEPYELAFYDALAQNQSARDVMGQDQLRELAIVLVARVRQNASIDWNLKESVRARMKVMVKRLLRQYGYPPDMQALAIELVLEQAKVFTEFEVETTHS